MKWLIIPALLMISNCTSVTVLLDEDKERRQNLKRNQVHYSATYEVDKFENSTLSHALYYDANGYESEWRVYDEDGSLNYMEQYLYDEKYRLIETKRGDNKFSLTTRSTREYDDIQNLETEILFTDHGIVYKSVYQNDSIGRNLSLDVYSDGALYRTYIYKWCGEELPCIVEEYDKNGHSVGYMERTFTNGRLVASVKYEGGKIVAKERFTYNSDGYTETVISERPHDYRHTTTYSYENGLVKEENVDLESLIDTYSKQEKYVWEYKNMDEAPPR